MRNEYLLSIKHNFVKNDSWEQINAYDFVSGAKVKMITVKADLNFNEYCD